MENKTLTNIDNIEIDNTPNINKENEKLQKQLDNAIDDMERMYENSVNEYMLWEPVYKDYISKFSKSYLSGNDIYIGDSLLKTNANIFQKRNTLVFLKKYFINHPLAPKFK